MNLRLKKKHIVKQYKAPSCQVGDDWIPAESISTTLLYTISVTEFRVEIIGLFNKFKKQWSVLLIKCRKTWDQKWAKYKEKCYKRKIGQMTWKMIGRFQYQNKICYEQSQWYEGWSVEKSVQQQRIKKASNKLTENVRKILKI